MTKLIGRIRRDGRSVREKPTASRVHKLSDNGHSCYQQRIDRQQDIEDHTAETTLFGDTTVALMSTRPNSQHNEAANRRTASQFSHAFTRLVRVRQDSFGSHYKERPYK